MALVIITTLVAGLISASFYEWALHRYLLHRPFSFFGTKFARLAAHWFKHHTRIHHMTFGFEASYHLQHDHDKDIIDMRKWAPYVIMGGMIPYLVAIPILYWLFEFTHGWTVLLTGLSISVCYYIAYEYLHWCMHLPKKRQLEMSGLFRRLNGHHLIHHRHMGKNFNVVFPFADWCMRTLLLRATVQFKQPIHAAVPNVQPPT